MTQHVWCGMAACGDVREHVKHSRFSFFLFSFVNVGPNFVLVKIKKLVDE